MPSTQKQVIIANGDYKLAGSEEVWSKNGFDGTFSAVQSGTGTWKLQYSPDKGVTKFDCKDAAGAVITGTASGSTNFYLGRGSIVIPMELYLNVTGAAALTLTTYVHSN